MVDLEATRVKAVDPVAATRVTAVARVVHTAKVAREDLGMEARESTAENSEDRIHNNVVIAGKETEVQMDGVRMKIQGPDQRQKDHRDLLPVVPPVRVAGLPGQEIRLQLRNQVEVQAQVKRKPANRRRV
jgi:hypothetical protein